jgi:glycosyltransferase involved in cell wall biosynthesis
LLSPYLVANSFAGLRANNIKIKRGRFVLYNGIETSFEYNYGIEKKDELRKKLIPSSNNGSIIFLSVANFVKNKDYRTVFKALSELADINYLYLIIGSGPYENDIKKDINRLKLDNKVIILGNKLNVVDYLAISNCFIHSSKGEGCSNAILEAMFNHLPIIATDSGGTSEIVFSETSTLFKYKDYKSLSKYLLDYSKTDLKIFSTAEYTKHMQQFSVQSMVSNFTQILNEVEFIEKIGKA